MVSAVNRPLGGDHYPDMQNVHFQRPSVARKRRLLKLSLVANCRRQPSVCIGNHMISRAIWNK